LYEEVAMEANQVRVGDAVVYVDPRGIERSALVTAVWGLWHNVPEATPEPSLNLVYVSEDESRTDSYGRQTAHATSTPHRGQQAAPGNYWKRPTE
jgi:hypothetical protein